METIDMEFEYKNNFVTIKDEEKFYQWTITDKKSVSSSVFIHNSIKDKFIKFLKTAQKKTCMFDSLYTNYNVWTISIIHDSDKIIIVNSVRFLDEKDNDLDKGSHIKVNKKKFMSFLNQIFLYLLI